MDCANFRFHGEGNMTINQGDIYWVEVGPVVPHPHVIIQDNVLNNTVIACALTSNLKRVSVPGNVLLEVVEASLPRQSVVIVAKVSTVDKAQLGEYIGTLSEQRVNQILAGVRFIVRSYLPAHFLVE
jgi:mRNA interferase MazF